MQRAISARVRGECQWAGSAVMAGADLVCALTPDDVEAEHQQDVLRWLQSTDDIYRRVTPAISQ